MYYNAMTVNELVVKLFAALLAYGHGCTGWQPAYDTFWADFMHPAYPNGEVKSLRWLNNGPGKAKGNHNRDVYDTPHSRCTVYGW